MLDVQQLRDLIIKPALMDLNLLSEEAVEMLVFTCAVETEGGTWLKQVKGDALGIYQMEPATYNDIWTNFIAHRNNLKLQLIHNFSAPVMQDEYRLVYDLRYATAMTRIYYERIPEHFPAIQFEGMWDYYKRYYNTSKGKAEETHARMAYARFTNHTLAS